MLGVLRGFMGRAPFHCPPAPLQAHRDIGMMLAAGVTFLLLAGSCTSSEVSEMPFHTQESPTSPQPAGGSGTHSSWCRQHVPLHLRSLWITVSTPKAAGLESSLLLVPALIISRAPTCRCSSLMEEICCASLSSCYLKKGKTRADLSFPGRTRDTDPKGVRQS